MELGVPLAGDKTEGPVRCLIFLGIELGTIAMTSRLPLVKLVDLREQILCFLGLREALLREFQVLLGHLNFACKVIAPGHAFVRRLCDALKGTSKPYHRLKVTPAIKGDLCVSLDFLSSFNWVAF